MNKKAQTRIGIAVISAIFIFIVFIPIINLIIPDVTIVRNSANLNCSNPSSISDGTKLTCLAIDLVIPIFIALIIGASGGLIISKFVG